jgi:transcriptional regulator NrdR family protein
VKCPVCSEPTKVVDKDGPERRRQCTGCGQKFTTQEVLKAERKREQQAVRAVLEAASKINAE